MGGCGSREKELREKLGFPQNEFNYALKKFTKMTHIKPGKQGEFFVAEGFKHYFHENIALSLKLYRFFRQQGGHNYVDLATFLTTCDLFTRYSMKMQNQNILRQADVLQLYAMISLQTSDTFNYQNAYKTTVTFSKAAKLFKELINMQSAKKEILCEDDDQAPLLLINNIFQNQSQLDFQTFIARLRDQITQANKIIKDYFIGKFINKSFRTRIPIYKESEILNRQLFALFNLSVPWFHKCQELEKIYQYSYAQDKQQYNFNQLANSLLQAKSPVLILFRHNQNKTQEQFIFGFFSATQWKISPDISGNRQSFIFCIQPKFKLFQTNRGQGQSKYAILIPIITKRSSQQLSQYGGPKTPGLGLGGSGYEQHRIWIDGKQLQNSWIHDEDKTFESGHILSEDIRTLNIDLIEVWALRLNQVGQSTTYFKSTQINNNLGDKNKTVNSNDLREVMVTLNQELGRQNKREGTREIKLEQQSISELPEDDEEEEEEIQNNRNHKNENKKQ